MVRRGGLRFEDLTSWLSGRGTSEPSIAARLVVALVVFGALLRLRHYADAHSLYIDEAFLALSISARPFIEVVRSMAWDQNTHVGFMLTELFALRLAGMNEWALRAPQFLAGIVLLFAVWGLARRLLSTAAAVLATAIVAVSPILIRYATEARPYGSDALIAVLLAVLATRVIDAPAIEVRWWSLGIGGVLGIILSLPALFVLAGIGSSLLLSPRVRQSSSGVRRTAMLCAGWVLLFSLEYLLFLRHSAGDPYLQYSFSETFLDPRAAGFAMRVSAAVQGLSTAYLFPEASSRLLPPKAITASLIIGAVGLVALARRNGLWVIGLLAGPVAAAVAASMLSRYPILPRTMLFSAPLLVMMLVAGAHSVVSLLPPRVAPTGFAVAGALLVFPTTYATVRQAVFPSYPYDIKSAISELRRLRQPGEAVFLSYNARAGWAFYTTDWATPNTARIAWLERSRHRRVAGELDVAPRGGPPDLFARRDDAGFEIVEHLPDGVMWVEAIPTVNEANEQPLDRWGKEEAERMRRYGNPTVWVLYQGSPPRFLSALLDGIQTVGATVDAWRQYSGVRLFRVRFSPR